MTCHSPLRINVGHRHRTVVDTRGGKPASTHLKVLESFQAAAFIQASPETGRTHQIRAHLASLGLPLLGDLLYGASATQAINRPALHSFSIEFSLNGREYLITAPHPQDFTKACDFLRRQKSDSAL
jgi:23S rRNA-/tRNA-specific pseudouridylate synthase